jgi:hypothetical protein
MKNRFLISLALLGALTALVAAGCGGDDETTSELTVDEWASQADEVCRQGDEAQQAAVRDFFEREGISQNRQPTSEQLQQLATEVVIPNIRSQIDGVAALPRPDEEADQIQAFVDQANADLDTLSNDPSLIEGSGNPFERTQALARDLGLEECAS